MKNFDAWPVLRNGFDISDPQEFSSLGECDMDYFVLDERGARATAGFILRTGDALPSAVATDPSHNQVSFFVLFSEVRDFRVEGWGSRKASDFTINRLATGAFAIRVQGPGTDISFSCASAIVSRVTTGRAGSF
jgi:hypothetical protein